MAARTAESLGRNPLRLALEGMARELRRARRRWALVGGLAVGARAEPRATRDVDVAVGVTGDAQAEALVHSLQARGYRVLSALEHQTKGRLATVRLVPPREEPGGVLVDLMFASCGIEPEVARKAEELEITPGLLVPVACIGHLLAMKVLARDDRRRPQDLDDIRTLLLEATEADLEDARQAMRLIEIRGYGRGRRLVARLERLRRRGGQRREGPA